MFAASKTASSGSAPDAQFNYVTMLLHGDGTNGAQNNTFLDSSTNNFTITRNGNTTQGSFSPYGSNWSNNFPTTSGDYLTIANNAAFTLGNTFTVECWLFRTASDDGTIVGRWYAGDSSGWLMHIFSGGKLAFGLGSGSYSNASASTIPLNTWTHLAVSNDTTSKRFYINGVLDATFSSDNCNSLGSINLTICQNTGGGYGIRSYISNLRIVKGTAVYTSNFTPPTAPLTAISGTSLLTCQSNRFIDNSTNNFTITPSGSPSVQRFNPFGASTAYSTSVIGGSGYFDGTDDYLSYTQQTYSGNFTMECWVYQIASSSSYAMLFSVGGANTQLMIDYSGTGKITFYYNSTAISSASGVFIRNQWNHIAYVRSGSTITIYYNGTSVASGTLSDAIPVSLFGGYSSSGYTLNGYMSDVRITTSALYTTTFTPPTAPLTAISGTSILLNMTNGAIFDNAMINDLETVGNAQISTSVVKYGTGSLAFDGSGDYLTAPLSPNMALGTGDFTIECWVRFVANPVGNGQGVCQLTNGYLNNTIRGPAYGVETSTGEWTIYYGTTYTQSGVVPTTGVWYHTAYVRSSGTTKLYVNGTSVISVADTTNYTDQYFTIGGWYGTGFLLNGYIDDFRITKGYARYTANFTPPTAAFPNTGPI